METGVFNPSHWQYFIDAEIAQLVEQRIRNAWVEGSSPFFGLIYGKLPAKFAGSFFHKGDTHERGIPTEEAH